MNEGITNTLRDQNPVVRGAEDLENQFNGSEAKNGRMTTTRSSSSGITDQLTRSSPNGGVRMSLQLGRVLRNVVPISREQKAKELAPIDTVNWFSKVTVSWMTKFLYENYRRRLNDDEWPIISPYEKCELNGNRMELLWQDELMRRGAKNASLVKVAWRFVQTRLYGVIGALLGTTLLGAFNQTVLLRGLLVTLEAPGDNLSRIVMWSCIIIVSEIIRSLLFMLTWILCNRIAMRLKAACSLLLYRKLIRLNNLGNTSTGEIVNLVANDCQRILELVMMGTMIIPGPIVIICAGCFVILTVGPIAMISIVMFILLTPLQYGISRLAGYFNAKSMRLRDARIRLMNEMLQCMKLIKMYAWQKPFIDNILAIRKKEQFRILGNLYCIVLGMNLAVTAPIVLLIITFLVHISTENTIKVSQAFPMAALLGGYMSQTMSRAKEAWLHIIESRIAFARMKKFLVMEEMKCISLKPTVDTNAVAIIQATFTYNGLLIANEELAKNKHKEEYSRNVTSPGFRNENADTEAKSDNIDVLFDVTFEVTKGKLIGICGHVGSGKSSLLLAALGQLNATQGQVMRDGTCAYVSQQAWIVSETLRENIVFGNSFDAARFHQAIHVCGLTHDIKMMPDGDQTQIGERGINLSGGQKQRVALARAFYADRDIYFLDDPLSAVDAHVGLHIFNHLITDALRGRTILFVTHQIQYLNRCDDVYMMRDGRIVQHGTHEELMDMDGDYAMMVNSISDESPQTNTPIVDDNAAKDPVSKEVFAATTINEKHSLNDGRMAKAKSPERLEKSSGKYFKDESIGSGSCEQETYMAYVRAAGGWFALFSVMLLYMINIACTVFASWWLVMWLKTGETNMTEPGTNVTRISHKLSDNSDYFVYRTIYASTIGFIIVTSLIRCLVYCKACTTAASYFHRTLFEKIISKPMRFFDTTPIGRIQNLFSSSLDEVDNRLPKYMDIVVQNVLVTCSAFATVTVVFPWFALPMCVILALFYFASLVYRTAVYGLKRGEHRTLSLLLSHITATSQGLHTIHAFQKAKDFEQSFIKMMDIIDRYQFVDLSAKRWVAARVDGLVSLVTAITLVFITIMRNEIAPASAGLALVYSAYVAGTLQYAIRMLSEAEAKFIIVESMNHYINLPETEDRTEQALTQVKSDWPAAGVLEFKEVSLAYDKDEPLVLNKVSFAIRSGEKIGIVGRTGAGKSSLSVALFRLVELSTGQIIIDNVDISTIAIDQLRRRLAIIPQEPVLFSGTIRWNLDPFHTKSDAEIWEALEKTKLKERIETMAGNLDATVGFEGDNLSLGEKQLLCLARALLRQTKILLLDEATAAVDPETESAVQDTIQKEFADATVLTIAHRLQTVISCDRILVMEGGCVAEFDSPSNLLADEDSQFAKMIAAAEKSRKK